MQFKIFTDGGSRGNPGHAGAGGIIISVDDNKESVIAEISEYLGIQTNNYAEYSSLIYSLNKAIELGIQDNKINVYMDSSLVINQVNGLWKVKHPNIIPLYAKVEKIIKLFNNITFTHVFRDNNKLADKLANKAMDSVHS